METTIYPLFTKNFPDPPDPDPEPDPTPPQG